MLPEKSDPRPQDPRLQDSRRLDAGRKDPRPQASVVIAFYKRLDFLEKIFLGLLVQTSGNFEVIVAEDDNSPETIIFLEKHKQSLPFPILHVSQEDRGFRKNMILNKAISVASSENILFLDGDSVPHREFVKTYLQNLRDGTACFGRRVMLGEKITASFLSDRMKPAPSFLSLLFSDSTRVEEGIYLPWYKKQASGYRGIWGCNWGARKNDIVAVNGFDEDYIKATVGEDVDIEWRMRQNGVKFRSLKHRALVYHLYHKENYNAGVIELNTGIFESKKKEGNIICRNGITKIDD